MYEGYYIGLMTGTSMDAVDTALVDIQAGGKIELLATHTGPLSDQLREKIIAVATGSNDSISNVSTLDHQLASAYAECVSSIMAS